MTRRSTLLGVKQAPVFYQKMNLVVIIVEKTAMLMVVGCPSKLLVSREMSQRHVFFRLVRTYYGVI